MSHSVRLITITVAVTAFCTLVTAQLVQVPRQSPVNRFANRFPPEIVLDRFIDVVKVAPQFFTVDRENSEVRVLRAKLDGDAKIPLHDERPAVMIALKDLHLRLITPDGKSRDIHLKSGETLWIDGDTFTEQNLSSTPTEFLLVEQLRPKGQVGQVTDPSYPGQ
jgi:hypothetical protein